MIAGRRFTPICTKAGPKKKSRVDDHTLTLQLFRMDSSIAIHGDEQRIKVLLLREELILLRDTITKALTGFTI